jgi:hypothetical protein
MQHAFSLLRTWCNEAILNGLWPIRLGFPSQLLVPKSYPEETALLDKLFLCRHMTVSCICILYHEHRSGLRKSLPLPSLQKYSIVPSSFMCSKHSEVNCKQNPLGLMENLNNTLWTQLVINFRSLCPFFFSSCPSSFYHDGLGCLACAQSQFINSEIKILQTVGRTPCMGDQPVPMPLPTQDNTNTE